jgi:hypothetical protein
MSTSVSALEADRRAFSRDDRVQPQLEVRSPFSSEARQLCRVQCSLFQFSLMPQCHLLTLIRRVAAMAIEGETDAAKT